MTDAFWLPDCAVLLASLCLCGCVHERSATAINVEDIGARVRTNYRYCCVGSIGVSSYNSKLRLYQPDVFSDDGIPFTMRSDKVRDDWYGQSDAAQTGQFLLYVCSAGTMPFFHGNTHVSRVSIEFPPPLSGQRRDISLCSQYDEATSLFSPLSQFLFNGTPCFPDIPEKSRKVFEKHARGIGSQGSTGVEDEAIAYGIACRLREMEDAGIINDSICATVKALQGQERQRRNAVALRQRLDMERQIRQKSIAQTLQTSPVSQNTTLPYRIINLERDGESDFSYRFALVLNGEPSIQTFFGIHKMFADEVRSAYHLEYPTADLGSLRIAVQPRLVNGRIEGRASVLTISPTSLSYDANTRQGKLSARFNSGQAEEAREWIRKNIETLARDKNIALTTGQLPPEAKYYSLGEKIDGNVMTIEFKTE